MATTRRVLAASAAVSAAVLLLDEVPVDTTWRAAYIKLLSRWEGLKWIHRAQVYLAQPFSFAVLAATTVALLRDNGGLFHGLVSTASNADPSLPVWRRFLLNTIISPRPRRQFIFAALAFALARACSSFLWRLRHNAAAYLSADHAAYLRDVLSYRLPWRGLFAPLMHLESFLFNPVVVGLERLAPYTGWLGQLPSAADAVPVTGVAVISARNNRPYPWRELVSAAAARGGSEREADGAFPSAYALQQAADRYSNTPSYNHNGLANVSNSNATGETGAAVAAAINGSYVSVSDRLALGPSAEEVRLDLLSNTAHTPLHKPIPLIPPLTSRSKAKGSVATTPTAGDASISGSFYNKTGASVSSSAVPAAAAAAAAAAADAGNGLTVNTDTVSTATDGAHNANAYSAGTGSGLKGNDQFKAFSPMCSINTESHTTNNNNNNSFKSARTIAGTDAHGDASVNHDGSASDSKECEYNSTHISDISTSAPVNSGNTDTKISSTTSIVPLVSPLARTPLASTTFRSALSKYPLRPHLERDHTNVHTKRRPLIFIGNHATLGVDMLLLQWCLCTKLDMFMRGVAHKGHFNFPLWSDAIRFIGGFPGTRETCEELLNRGWSLLLYPGGGREVMRRADDPPYKLYWGSRLGFAKLAIATGAVVVPVASVGASETFPVAADVSLEWLWGRNKDLTVVTAAEVAADAVSAAASARVSDSVTNGGAETAVAATGGSAATALGDSEGGASDQDILSPPHNPRTMRSSTAAAPLHSAANANAGVVGSASSGTLVAGTENTATAQGAVSSSFSSSKVPAAGSKSVSGVRSKHTDGSTPVSVPIAIPWPQHWQRWYFKIGEPIDASAWAGQEESERACTELRDLTHTTLMTAVTELQQLQASDPDRYTLTRWARGLAWAATSTLSALTPFAADFSISAGLRALRLEQDRREQRRPHPARTDNSNSGYAHVHCYRNTDNNNNGAAVAGNTGATCSAGYGAAVSPTIEPFMCPMSPSSYITPVANSAAAGVNNTHSAGAKRRTFVPASSIAQADTSSNVTSVAGGFSAKLSSHAEETPTATP